MFGTERHESPYADWFATQDGRGVLVCDRQSDRKTRIEPPEDWGKHWGWNLTQDGKGVQLEDTYWEDERRRLARIRRVLGTLDMSALRYVIRDCQEEMRKIADKTLKPGTDEVITDLATLDMAWGLPGGHVDGDIEKPYLPRYLDFFVGRRVDTFGGVGPLVKTKDGYGIEIEMACSGEGCTETLKVYACPGCHLGAFCYVYDENGEFLADLRNQCYTCDKCRPAQARLDDIDRREVP